jgi:23S rRNA pseudouridine1911/1915/1917 synthase
MVGYRELEVPPFGDGMRLDRFLAVYFHDRSRSWMNRGVREGLVRGPDERPLRPACRVRAGDTLRLYLPEIAPSAGAPPFPDVLYEDDRVIAIDKPAGLLTHPAGTRFAWAVISMAKQRWGSERVDLVHRLDRDTSGVLLLTKDLDANRSLKRALVDGDCAKEYLAICRGVVPWDELLVDAPIGYRGGVVRIQMGVRDDGLDARTTVTVLARHATHSLVRCRLHTGRTHQIRVHLEHVGHAIWGDRLYGVPPEIFLESLDHGLTDRVLAATGAPRHALHAARTSFPHPDGGWITVDAPLPDDMRAWWTDAGGEVPATLLSAPTP